MWLPKLENRSLENRPLEYRSLAPARLARIVAITAATAAFCGYLDQFTQTFEPLEQRTYSERLEVSARVNPTLVRQAQSQIALVTFSDSSTDWAEHQPRSGQFAGPFLPRSDQAKMIQELTRDGAKVIAFDFLFDAPQPGDAALAAAVRRSGRVVLACGDAGKEHPKIVFPEARLIHAGARAGHTRIPINLERPAVDRMEPLVASGGSEPPVPALCLQALLMAGRHSDRPPRRTKDGWQIGGTSVPVDADGTFKISYLGASDDVFPPIPYEAVVDPAPGDRSFFADNGTFQNKIVLVGDSTLIHNDNHLTPFGIMPGVAIHAQALATLLEGRFLREASRGTESLQIIVLAALAAFAASLWRLRRAALFLLLLLPVYSFFNVWMFVERSLVLHLVAPSVTLGMTMVGVLLERGLAEEREKTQMRGLLLRYVNPQIAAYLLKHPELLGRKGRRVTGTVLFSDIRGFTALSERLPPEELVGRMNEYFQTVTDIVFRHDGTAVSIIGDALLAVFGVPVFFPDHAGRAVAAALEIQAALEGLQGGWQAQEGGQVQAGFSSGIGINTGEMVVGDVGGKYLMNFTVYGLHVNIASRVEELNKTLGSRILITRSTYQSLADQSHTDQSRADQFLTEPLNMRGPATFLLKGMEDPIEVFEVVGMKSK